MFGLWSTIVRRVFSLSDIKNSKSLEYAVEEKPFVVNDKDERDIETLFNIKEGVKHDVVKNKYGTFNDVAEFHKDNKQTSQAIENHKENPLPPTSVAKTARFPVSTSVFPPAPASAERTPEVDPA